MPEFTTVTGPALLSCCLWFVWDKISRNTTFGETWLALVAIMGDGIHTLGGHWGLRGNLGKESAKGEIKIPLLKYLLAKQDSQDEFFLPLGMGKESAQSPNFIAVDHSCTALHGKGVYEAP